MSNSLDQFFMNHAHTERTTPMKDFDEDTVLEYMESVYKHLDLGICSKCYTTKETTTGKKFRPDGYEDFAPQCDECK